METRHHRPRVVERRLSVSAADANSNAMVRIALFCAACLALVGCKDRAPESSTSSPQTATRAATGASDGPRGEFHFRRYDRNPIFEVVPGSWESGWVHPYSVLPVADGYAMWYGGGPTSSPMPDVPISVGYATSKDGFKWVRHQGNPIVEPRPGAWDAHRVEHWTVLPTDAGYAALYAGERRKDRHWEIGYAESKDGLSWTRFDEPVLRRGPQGSWDSAFVIPSSVLRHGDEYRLYYWAGSDATQNETYGFGLATSPDLKTWTRYPGNPILDGRDDTWETAILDATVIRHGDVYYMFYQGNDPDSRSSRLNYAYSQDGLKWMRAGTGRYFFGNGQPGSWDDRWTEGPVVLEVNGKYQMYYMGLKTGVWKMQIGVAYADDTPD